jgi:hypothetical protein
MKLNSYNANLVNQKILFDIIMKKTNMTEERISEIVNEHGFTIRFNSNKNNFDIFF